MSDFLDNVATEDEFADVGGNLICAFSPAGNVRRINFDVFNQPVFAQFWVYSRGQQNAPTLEGRERRYNANSVGIQCVGVAGVKFRSAIPGSPALVHGERVFVTDPDIAFGSVSPTGLTPDGQADSALSVQYDTNEQVGDFLHVQTNGDTEIDSGGEIALRSGPDFELILQAAGAGSVDIDTDLAGSVNIGSQALDVNIRARRDANVTADNDFNVTATEDVSLLAHADANMHADGELNLSGTGGINIGDGTGPIVFDPPLPAPPSGPSGAPPPTFLGMLAWNFVPFGSTRQTDVGVGVIELQRVPVAEGETVSAPVYWGWGGSTPTLTMIGLYRDNPGASQLDLVAAQNVSSILVGGYQVYITDPYTVPYVVQPGDVLYTALYKTDGYTPILTDNVDFIGNGLLGGVMPLFTTRYSAGTGLTSMPASIGYAFLDPNSQFTFWAGVA